MKRILFLLITVLSYGLGFGQIFNIGGGGTFPAGWVGTNNVTSNAIDKGSYYLVDAGNPSDIITSASYDLSAFASAEFSIDVATFGSGGALPAKIEFSFDGGATFTQTEVSATPSSSSYISGGTFTLNSVTNQVVVRISNNGTNGRGVRLRNLTLTGIGVGSTDTELNFASATYSAGEGDGTIDLCVDITNPSATPTTANVVLTSSNSPHVTYSTTAITFPANSSAQQCVTVNITDNTNCSDATDYTFEIQSVSGGTNASSGATDETTLSISDDDGTSGNLFVQDFDGTTPVWSFSGSGTSGSSYGNSGNGIRISDGQSFTLSSVNTSNISNLLLSLKAESTGGIENADALEIFVALDGASFSSTPDITIQELDPSDNSYNKSWDYNASGVATTTAGTPASFFGEGSTGYSTIQINIPDGTSSVSLKIEGNSNSSSEYFHIDDIILSGESCSTPMPEINVQGNATDIASGNTAISTTNDTDFGDVLITGGSQTNTFTIQNTGDLVLNITSITSDLSDFTIGTVPTTIAATSSETFTITFDPTTTGTKTATITIVSDDADEASYTFNVEGNATDVPSIVLNSSNPAVAAGNILADGDVDNTVIYAFDLSVTNFAAELTAFDFTTSGTYAAGNITNFKAWYSADATFSSSTDTQLDFTNSSLGTGTHTFTGFSQTIANGSTGYIFITADLPCGATDGNTIIVNAITTADLTFTVGTATGTAYDGGAQTITEVTPNNVTGLATANCENGGVDVSWTAVTGCLDNYIVVASPTALTTAPSGDGSSYTANAAYGSGTAYDGGYVVYKGTGTSVSISNLTNGTNYTYTVFTRNGESWSSGVEVDCTPSVIYCAAGPTSSSDSEIENVVLNGENNNISNNTTDACTGSTGGFVNDFTAQSADLNQGDSYTLSVEFGDCNNSSQFNGAGGVWIDWNNDGDFDDTDEEIGKVDVAVSGGNVIEIFTINVPSSQAIGNYRMRIVQEESGDIASVSPCGTFSWGSVEDYTIEVLSPCTPTHTFTSMVPTSGPVETEITVTGTGFTASTTASFDGVSATVDFVDATTLIVHVPSGATSGTITLTEAACDIATGTFTIVDQSGTCSTASNIFSDLIISEVYDADGGSLGYIEVYNGTGATIDLSTYTIRRYGDLTTTSYNTPVYSFPATGTGSTIADGEVLVGAIGTGYSSSIYDFIFDNSNSGFNDDDRLELYDGSTLIDDWHDDNVSGTSGFSYLRNLNVTNPNTTFDLSEWTASGTESTSDLGTFISVVTVSPPTVSAITDSSDCSLIDFSVTATAGNSGTLTYAWYFNDGVATDWTAVNATNLSGYTILGEDGVNLLIAGDTNPLSDLDAYQFYCEVTEDASCSNVSNAEKFVFASDRYYRSIVTGNWNVGSNWEVGPSTTGPWSVACTYPTETNSDYISIESGTNITLNIDLAADQIIVQSGATLFLDEKLTVTNGNATGEDLEVIGTLEDHGNTTNGLAFTNGGTWKLGAAGTIIKTNNSSVNSYRDAYETGIANIPSTADWAFVYDGSGTVRVASLGMYYPNLHFESTSGARDANGFAEFFQGNSGFTTVKGDLSIGVGSISGGTDAYKVYNNNLNAQPMLILGDVYIEVGSEFTNLDVAAGTDNGTGIEVKGSFLIEGDLDMSAGTGITLLSGTSTQDIISLGTGSYTTYEFELDNTSNAELDGLDVVVTNTLTFTDGKILTDVTTSDMVFVQNSATTAIVGGVAQNATSKYVEGKLQWRTDGTSTYTFPIGDATHGAQGFTTDLVSGTSGAEILAFLDANNSAPILAYAYCDLETYPGPAGAIVNAGNGTAGYDGVLDQIEYNIESPLQWNITNPSTAKIMEYDLTVLATGTQDITPVTTANGVDVRYLMKNGEPGNPSYATTTGAPNFNSTGFDACPNQYTLSGLTSFSKFTLDGATQSATTLPVDLLFFDAEAVNNKIVKTTWATVTEINNDYFIVERSKDGVEFYFVGNVQGAGNYNGQLNYSLVDETPFQGTSYYRLKQTDFDGQFEYSNIVAVNLTENVNTSFSVYPIPFNNSVTVTVNNQEEVTVIVYDVSGKIIVSDKFISTKVLNMEKVASGTYVINLKTNSKSETIKLIK